MGPCADSLAGEEDRRGSAPARSTGRGSASGVHSMVTSLLQLGHCSGTTPGLVAWLPPYLWSWNSSGRNMATSRLCRKTQGASVLGIASFPQPARESMWLLMLGFLSVPAAVFPTLVLQVHESR